MSKKKSNKKKQNNVNNTKKKMSKDTKALLKAGGVVLAVVVVVALVYIIYSFTIGKPSGLENTYWKSVSAYDASKDEVDITEVYNNYYSEYQGSMNFNDDMTFSYWMSAGDPEDGTHSGTYTYNSETDTVNAVFDSGDEEVFTIVRNDDDTIERIETPYGDYTIWFVPKD